MPHMSKLTFTLSRLTYLSSDKTLVKKGCLKSLKDIFLWNDCHGYIMMTFFNFTGLASKNMFNSSKYNDKGLLKTVPCLQTHVYQPIGSVQPDHLVSESLSSISKTTIKQHNNIGLLKVVSTTLNKCSVSKLFSHVGLCCIWKAYWHIYIDEINDLLKCWF